MNDFDGILQRLAMLEEKVKELGDQLESNSSTGAKDGGARARIQTPARILDVLLDKTTLERSQKTELKSQIEDLLL
jgi:hypothetical protein